MTDPRPPLSPARFQLVKELFDQALTTSPEQREALLLRCCGDDSALREEVESLLHALDRASDEWERPLAPRLVAAELEARRWGSDPLHVGTRLGAYVVTRKVGEGGMGAVYEAVRADASYEGRVAIKTIGRGSVDPTLTRRLIRERQILARLQHPNIATLLDGGTTDEGVPYLVMEFVEGSPLDQHCADAHLTIDQRLDLFRQVCGAIQFAHRNLVVHRDLKPSNILVTPDGVVKLLDFGIAKLITPDLESDDGATRDGAVPLTSAYASPEQARGDDITTATDVYSAGVVLYRLLSGAAPYDMSGKSPSDVRLTLSTRVPPLPSAVATDEHARRCGMSDASALRRTLAGELDAIVMMALRKEAERRYASIEAMSQDLHRYLRGLPVSARPDTLRYRLATLVRRRRALVVGSTVAVLSLVIGAGVAVWQAHVARAEAARATRITQFLSAVVGAADPAHYSTVRTGRRDVGMLEVLDSTRSRVVNDLAGEPRTRADLYWSMANAYRAFGKLDLALMLHDSARTLHSQTVGSKSLEVARDVHFAGVTLQEMGRDEEAVQRFRDARSIYLSLRAVPDSELTDVEGSLGQMLGVRLNRLEEGEQLLRSAERRALGEAQPRYALHGLVVGALAGTLANQRKFAAADSAFARALEAYARDSVRSRGERAVVLTNWGLMKSRQGRFAEAVALKQRALADARTAYGDEHLTVLRIQQRLSDDLLELGRLAEAQSLVESTLAALSRLSVVMPAERGNLLRVRGAVAIREHRFPEAAVALDSAQRQVELLSGVARAGPAVALLTERGRLAEAQGDTARAAAAMARAFRLALDSLGPTHLSTQAALGRLAAFHRRTGDVTRAESLLADSVRYAVAAR